MPIPLRADYDASEVRLATKRSNDGAQTRRLLALAAIYEGASRTEATLIGSVTVQIVRDWVVKFNAHGPSGLIDRKPPGQPWRLTDMHRAAMVRAIKDGPIPSIHGVVRWRRIDLCQWLWDTFEGSVWNERGSGFAVSDFKGRHFEGETILWAVRRYCRYGVSYRNLEQMMGECGVSVDHATIYRWGQKYAPEIEKRLRWQWCSPLSTSWRVDETYVKA